MKLSNIKTSDDFYRVSDIWYNRTLYLTRAWRDQEQIEKKREKALSLWWIMFSRMQKIIEVHIGLNTPKNVFKKGGITVGENKQFTGSPKSFINYKWTLDALLDGKKVSIAHNRKKDGDNYILKLKELFNIQISVIKQTEEITTIKL
jgi:hypothetical protein